MTRKTPGSGERERQGTKRMGMLPWKTEKTVLKIREFSSHGLGEEVEEFEFPSQPE